MGTMNPRVKMRIPELIRQLEANGWLRVRLRGPHRQYVHPEKPGLLTIRRHLVEELGPGALQSVLQHAGVVP
jgi:predicted RNA binding protein YcfA (HicA-like mRNA interferase family)